MNNKAPLLRALLYISIISYPSYVLAGPLPDSIDGVPNKSIEDVLADATGWLVWFGVSICLAALIWGGLSYVSSLGSQENAQKAKKTITYAILGLLVIGFSYAIIALINRILITG